MSIFKQVLNLVENGYIPDHLIKYGIKLLCKRRLNDIKADSVETLYSNNREFINESRNIDKLAEHTKKANEQHYELPTTFFKLILGDNLKYSCCNFSDSNGDITSAEIKTLELYCKRAELVDGQEILDLGCGWGSLSIFLAKKYPNSKITSVSNSKSQKQYIIEQCRINKLSNINVVTCDVNNLSFTKKFDRVISIEMMEHIKNHYVLFNKISSWLKPNGLLFIHVFCHKIAVYPFQVKDNHDWMAKYFFTGGIMPSSDLFLYYQENLLIKDHWIISGNNYKNTCYAWLANLDKNSLEIKLILKQVYGKEFNKWFQRWRLFFMGCAETFGYNKGNEWLITHYLFKNKP